MATPVPVQTSDLSTRFPNILSVDSRPGFSGWIIDKTHLLDFATALRDEFGYDYLSSITGVDYLPEGKMEVVYQVYKTTGGPGLIFKVQVPREDPVEIPSLVSIYPGAELQEREAWDLLGIKFTGHPDLRRILMWEDFAGFPLRKDWHEPYFEEEAKPFKSRWPEGKIVSSESKNAFDDNIAYPEGFKPGSQAFDPEKALYDSSAKLPTK